MVLRRMRLLSECRSSPLTSLPLSGMSDIPHCYSPAVGMLTPPTKESLHHILCSGKHEVRPQQSSWNCCIRLKYARSSSNPAVTSSTPNLEREEVQRKSGYDFLDCFSGLKDTPPWLALILACCMPGIPLIFSSVLLFKLQGNYGIV